VRAWSLTVSALADLQNIQSYGEENWGERQSRRYIEELYELFDSLARVQGMGMRRPELGVSVRSFLHTSHVVFYIPLDDRIVIVRVLHGAMDYAKLLLDYDPLTDLPD
jgi:toxin ParE1/3/4